VSSRPAVERVSFIRQLDAGGRSHPFELFIELAASGEKQANAKHIEEIAKGQNLRIQPMGRYDALTKLEEKPPEKTLLPEPDFDTR
jgi:hypothetical protein